MMPKNKAALLGMFIVATSCHVQASVATVFSSDRGAGSSAVSSVLSNKMNIVRAAVAAASGVYAFRNARDAYGTAKGVIVPETAIKKIESGHPLTEEETMLYLVYLQQINELENLKSKMLQGALGFTAFGGPALIAAIAAGTWSYMPNMPYFGAVARTAVAG